MTMHDIELKDLRFAFPSVEMQFELSIAHGSLTIVTGPSGSGKSTLLNLIVGFETPVAGNVILMGKDVTAHSPSMRPVAMLFQDHNLFDHLTVEANVGLGIRANLRLNADDEGKVRDALHRVGLDGKGTRLPGELSGGERQRVAFARILVQNRPILLLDEPFASLGPALRLEMTRLLADLQREKKLTVLAVTHHPAEWREVADGFVFVDGGKIAAKGSMEELALPHENAAIQAYLG
jgi:thiamine transport system ATP-binding protein